MRALAVTVSKLETRVSYVLVELGLLSATHHHRRAHAVLTYFGEDSA